MGGPARSPVRGPAAALFLYPYAAEIPHRQPVSGAGAGLPAALCLTATAGEEAAVYHDVETGVPTVLKKRGAKSCYEAAVFRDLVYTAQKAAISRMGMA